MQTIKQVSLYFKDGSSDKEYHAQIVQGAGGRYLVNFQYGRRGSTLTAGTKTKDEVDLDKAEKAFEKIVKEKKAKGYTEGESGTPYVGGDKEERKREYAVQLLNAIEESQLDELFRNPIWVLQEKLDGKRMLLRYSNVIGDSLGAEAINRSGLVCGAPTPILEKVEQLAQERTQGGELVIDGECIGDYFFAFDVLVLDGKDIRGDKYIDRHAALIDLAPSGPIKVVPIATSEHAKRTLFEEHRKAGNEGVVFKDKYAWYSAGRPNSGGSQLKFKFKASATVQVMCENPTKRSVGIAVFDEHGQTVGLGNVTIPPNYEVPGTGQLIEVEYLYAYRDGSLFQPVYKGVRDDKAKPDLPDTLKYKGEELKQAA